jgi:hypothetical protein
MSRRLLIRRSGVRPPGGAPNNTYYIEVLFFYLKYDIIPKKIRRIRMTLEFVDNYLNAKLAQNREIIKFSFYEVRMKLNLSEEDSITFLSLISQKLMNTGYLVYKTGEEYTYKGKTFKIQENELLVAILKESAK